MLEWPQGGLQILPRGILNCGHTYASRGGAHGVAEMGTGDGSECHLARYLGRLARYSTGRFRRSLGQTPLRGPIIPSIWAGRGWTKS
jgi:hypothetical protein